MLERGFVMIDRKLLNWRWYTEPNTMRLFLHLLMTVNYEDHDYLDFTVKRGQRVTSYSVLSEELKMSVQSIRTVMKHLEKTGELTRETNSKFTVVTLNNYDDFILSTNAQQADNKQQTVSQQPADNYGKKNNNYKNKKKISASSDGFDSEKYSVFINRF